MKKVLIIILLAFVAIFATSCGLVGRTLEAIIDEMPTPTPVPIATPEPTPTPTPAPALPQTGTPVQDGMRRVGSERLGFVDIPSYWLSFRDLAASPDDGLNVLQFSDPTGANILTMQYVDISDTPVNTEDFADLMVYFMATMGGAGVHSLPANLNGIDVFRIVAFFPSDGDFVTTFVFESECGTFMHQITIEGTSDGILETYGFLESSFSFSQ